MSRRAKTVAGVWQWIEPWSVVSSTGTFRRSASRSASQSGERSNQVRVRFRSACGVARHLEERRVLGAAVGQLVDEVEDQRRHPVLRQVRRQPAEQSLAVGGGEHLFVAHRHLAPGELAEVLLQQRLLVGVEADSSSRPPPVGVAGRELVGKSPLKIAFRANGVAVGRMEK